MYKNLHFNTKIYIFILGIVILLYPGISNWISRMQQIKAISEYQKDGEGMLGYIEIPAIDVLLPIYEGTGEKILQKGVGHMEGTSWPIDCEGGHCVLAAHRGLPSSEMFRNLDQITTGNYFMIYTADGEFVFKVVEIVVAEPEQIEYILPEDGKVYCTLLTCTPYGINSHRLLVKGCLVDVSNLLPDRSDCAKLYR